MMASNDAVDDAGQDVRVSPVHDVPGTCDLVVGAVWCRVRQVQTPSSGRDGVALPSHHRDRGVMLGYGDLWPVRMGVPEGADGPAESGREVVPGEDGQ